MIEKSAAKEAYIPSLPTIPKPTSAAWIIATSFPPSPTQATRILVKVFKFYATTAFCVGEQRQMHTVWVALATSKNNAFVESFVIIAYKVVPSIISIWVDVTY